MEDPRPFRDLFGDRPRPDENAVSFASPATRPLAASRPLSLGPFSPEAPVSPTETVYSPMTSLALNLNEKLNTSGEDDEVPKKKLNSIFDGVKLPFDSTSAEVARITDSAISRFDAVLDNDASPKTSKVGAGRGARRMKTCLRRVKSMTVEMTSPLRISPNKRGPSSPVRSPRPCKSPRLPLGEIQKSSLDESPRRPLVGIPKPNLEEENSQDSGIGCDKDKASLEDFRFATPVGLPPRRSRHPTDECANSPLRYSPVSESFSPQCLFPRQRALSPSFESTAVSLMKSPIMRNNSAESTNGNDSDDDGFLELIDIDDDDHLLSAAPKGLSSLINAPLVNTAKSSRTRLSPENKENTPTPQRCVPRGLFRSPSAPRLGVHLAPSPAGSPFELYSRPMNHLASSISTSNNNKRPEPDDNTPVITKRRKSVVDEQTRRRETSRPRSSGPKFQRSISDSETQIKNALSRPDHGELIGDFSRSYCLPTVPGKHSDLRAISAQTMADLIDRKFDHIVEQFVVVDCRYPYEYEGGHIKGAKNLYQKDEIMRELLTKPRSATDPDKRYIVIFHCEFSSERGPRLCRFLRSQDRLKNNDHYPQLYYPELYLLEGGYKEFYQHFPTYNVPQTYKPMLHEDHGHDLRHFRAKSKSWAGEKNGGRNLLRTGLKF